MKFGSVGRMQTEVDSRFTFMLICPRQFPEFEHLKHYWQVIIIEGSVPFEGRIMGVGDVGPIKITDKRIEWLS